MKIEVMVVGKTTDKTINELINGYAARICHYLPFGITVIPELKNTKSLSEAEQKEREADALLKAFLPGDYLVLLDERGKTYTSEEFASFMERKSHTISRRLVFVVGGPYGFSGRIYDAAAEQVSLSRMTFSHQLVRLFFVEQIYRGQTILHNEPYHHR